MAVGSERDIDLRNLAVIGLLTACICGVYLPWKWTSFLLLPLYLFALSQRKTLDIDSWIKYAFAMFFGYMVIFTVFSQVPKHSIKGLYDCLRGLLLFPVGLAFAQKITDRRSWFVVNCVAFCFVLGTLLYPQRWGGYSFYENPNNAAVLLVLLICLLVPPSDAQRPVYPYIISGVGLTLAAYLLYLTNGRGAWLGISAGLLCVTFFKINIKKKFKALAGLSILVSLTTILLIFNRKGFRLSEREDLWSGLFFETFDNHLFMGYGFNCVKDLIDQLGLITRTAHNIELEIFVSSGIIGLIFIFYLVFYLWKSFARYSYSNSPIFISGLLCIIAFLVMGQFDLKFSSFRFIGTLSFFLGLIYSQKQIRSR